MAGTVFSKHEDDEFSSEFGKMVHLAYKDLFDLHADKSWTLDQNKLISFFRGNDQTSANVGHRQAVTFQTLATLSGRLEAVKEKTASAPKSRTASSTKSNAKAEKKVKPIKVSPIKEKDGEGKSARDFGLTVRIEINLPAGADKETYDKIFQSLRENILNAE